MQMLQEQQNMGTSLGEFQPIEFDDLESLPVQTIDQSMANEIYQVAEEAKREAQAYRQSAQTETVVNDMSQQELVEINQAPVNVDQLMQSIQADSQIIVQRNESGATLSDCLHQQRLKMTNVRIFSNDCFIKYVHLARL